MVIVLKWVLFTSTGHKGTFYSAWSHESKSLSKPKASVVHFGSVHPTIMRKARNGYKKEASSTPNHY